MMNPGGLPGRQHVIAGSGGLVSTAGGRVINIVSGGLPNTSPQTARRPPPPPSSGSKLMRLRCRFRPLHDQYIKNGMVVEEDTDVIFLCGDGHQLRAHKVIMASSSKFFAKIFEDQTSKISVVSVPDIKVDIMKLILQLTYRDRVFLTMNQIKEVGEFITIFGMAWTQFGYEEYNGEEQMTALPQAPVPLKPVELPRKHLYTSPPPKPQISQLPRKSIAVGTGPLRSPAQAQNLSNGNENEEGNASGIQSQSDRRKSRLTPRQGTEGEEIVEQDEEDDPENLIRDWMAKLGKRDGSPNGPITVKRIRTSTEDDQSQNEQKSTGGASSSTSAASSNSNMCSVCKTRFQTEIAWKWHQERHVGVGMFKCKFCDDMTKTPKLCYIHEKEVHGYSGLQQQTSVKPKSPSPQQNQQKSPQQQSQSAPSQGPSKPATLVFRSNQSGKFVSVSPHNLKRLKLNNLRKLQPKRKAGSVVIVSKSQEPIGIGKSQGAELMDEKKIKQLHWLYICSRCENCSDTAQKAVYHYNKCYPEKDQEFEQTVTKYRQGFYGKSKCPLCPRRFPQNSGFMIHCGHQHQEFRRLFTHTGSVDDQLKCINCKECFPLPEGFHQHLDTAEEGSLYCPEEPKEEPVVETPPPNLTQSPASKPGRPPGGGKTERAPRVRRPESPIEHKAQYKVQFHTPPKSARLASRVQAEAQAEAAAAAKKSQSASASTSTVTTDINFPPVDCPVCGDSDLPNISVHLQAKHKDLNVDVTRISSELLRCKGCTITFDICDLLDHKNCLANGEDNSNMEDDFEPNSSASSSRRTSTSSTAKSTPKSAVVADIESLPEGVGRSPIESIEIEDLHSVEAIRKALKCGVCGKEAMRLGIIADCLRAHGVHRCSLCFNSYCSKTDYGLHLRKCHGAGSSKLKCPLCPKAFANAGQTSGHMYSTHWLTILREHETMLQEKAMKKAIQARAEAEAEDKLANENYSDDEPPPDITGDGETEPETNKKGKGDEEETPIQSEKKMKLDDDNPEGKNGKEGEESDKGDLVIDENQEKLQKKPGTEGDSKKRKLDSKDDDEVDIE